jgi:hypothetical protein
MDLVNKCNRLDRFGPEPKKVLHGFTNGDVGGRKDLRRSAVFRQKLSCDEPDTGYEDYNQCYGL